MSAETDAVIDYDSLTANGRTELHFRQLCRRLLDIDGECGIVKGCSANLAAAQIPRCSGPKSSLPGR